MWFQIALALVSFVVMNFLAPKPQVENARASKLGDFKFPRSNEGDPVPLVYGTVKVSSPNTIWTGGFRTKRITQFVSTGMFGGTTQTIGYKYRIGFDLAWCLGPNVAVKKIWAGKKRIFDGFVNTESRFSIGDDDLFGGDKKGGGFSGEVTFYPGNSVQSRNAYMVDIEGNANIPGYAGTCHLVCEDFYVGTSPSIQAVSAELQCFTNSLGIPSGQNVMPNGLDMNPIEILYDIGTTKWGRLGVRIDNIDLDNWRSVAATIYAEGNGMSLNIQNANSGKDIFTEVLRQIDGLMYQDPATGKIKITLVRNDYVVGTLPILNQSNILEISDYKKNLWGDTFNQVRIKYISRQNEYADAAMTAQDLANINYQQRVRNSDVAMPGCFDSDLAPKLASRSLAQLSVPLFQAEISVNRTQQTLRPGSVVNVVLPEYGIAQIIMRVRQMSFGELVDGALKLTLQQDVFGTDKTLFLPSPPTSWQPITNDANPIAFSFAQAAPYWMQARAAINPAPDTQALLVALARAPSTVSAGYELLSSMDAFVTAQAAINNAPYAGAARLVAAYPVTVGTTAVDAVGFKVYASDDLSGLANATVSLITTQGRNLFWIDDELMGFTTIVNNNDGTYNISGIYRALLDTKVAAHNVDANVFFGPTADALTLTRYGLTDVPTVKFIDQTTADTYNPTLVAATAVTIDSRPQRPLPNVRVSVNGNETPPFTAGLATFTVAWRQRNRLDATIRTLADATQTPEATQTSRIRYRFGTGAYTSQDVAGTSVVLTPSGMPTVRTNMDVEVWSLRSSLISRISQVVSFDVQAVAIPVISNVSATIGNSNPLIVGTAQPGATVQVAVDAVNFGTTAVADGSGNWSIRLTGLTEAAHAITARATLGPSTSAYSAATTLTVVWYDPDAYLFIDLANDRYRRNGVITAGTAALFTSRTVTATIVRGADGKYKSSAANAIPSAPGLGLETWLGSTNNLTSFNANPTATTNTTKTGNATATYAILADSATLNTGDLQPLVADATINGNVFDLNNSVGGTGDAIVTFAGAVGTVSTKTASIFAVVTGGSALLQIGGVTVATIPAGTQYVRYSGQRTPAVTTELMSIVAPIGVRVRFVLQQVETSVFATAPIIIAGVSAARVNPTISGLLTSADTDVTQGTVITSQQAVSNTANGLIFMYNLPDSSNRLYMQFITPNIFRCNYQVAGVSATIDVPSYDASLWHTAGYAYAAANFACSVDGAAPVTRLGGSVLATSATYNLILSSAGQWQGWTKYLAFYKTRLTNTQLQERSQWTTVI